MSDHFRFVPYRLKNWLKRIFRPAWAIYKRLPDQIALLGARTAARVVPSISIDRDRLYPPTQICELTSEWVSKSGEPFQAKIINVEPSCIIPNPLPKTVHDKVRQQFLMDASYVYPETFVATIPGGRVTSRGFVMTPDRQFLQDVSTYFHDPKTTLATALSQDWRPVPVAEVDAKVAVLATEGANLYYHWLLQLLPRYELIRRAGVELKDIDYYYVNSQRSRFQRETLAVLGIEPARIIDGDKVPHLRARELIVPSVPLSGGCFRPWMMEFLRDSFIPKNVTSSGRRLYISRGRAGYRRVLNEDEVINFLRRRNFEVFEMEGLSVQEQAAVMASSDVVVAPHGGGLSNILFCSPATKIIEIYAPELVATYFWKLSNQLQLDYYYLLAKGPPATLDPDYPQSWDARTDIEVDLELLERTLTLAAVN
jgi:capsular polysaccharide biosynthesis protein